MEKSSNLGKVVDIIKDIEQLIKCPLCLSNMIDPVIDRCGHNFCQECISKTLESSNTCPLSKQTFDFEILYPNLILRNFIDKYYKTEKRNKLIIEDESDFDSNDSRHYLQERNQNFNINDESFEQNNFINNVEQEISSLMNQNEEQKQLIQIVSQKQQYFMKNVEMFIPKDIIIFDTDQTKVFQQSISEEIYSIETFTFQKFVNKFEEIEKGQIIESLKQKDFKNNFKKIYGIQCSNQKRFEFFQKGEHIKILQYAEKEQIGSQEYKYQWKLKEKDFIIILKKNGLIIQSRDEELKKENLSEENIQEQNMYMWCRINN